MLKKIFICLTILCLAVTSLSAQSGELSAAVRILGDEVFFQRVNTDTEFLLSEGANAPFGIGDVIRTGQNGRVLITVNEDTQILVLPNSTYEIIDFSRDEAGHVSLGAQQEGIVLHDFNASTEDFTYQLETSTFSISQAEGRFLVWAVPTGLQAVTVSTGTLTLEFDDNEYFITDNRGFAIEGFDIVVPLSAPLHASQAVARSVNCQGIVDTGGSEGLRLRAGAAIDYQIVDVLADGQAVSIVGATENGLWYRLPFQTGFGWIYSDFIVGTCVNLSEFVNLVDERPEQIDDATEIEIELLEPFYGTPQSNLVFFR